MEEYQTAWGWELASYKKYIANLVIKHTIYPLVNWAILKLQLTLKLLPKQCVGEGQKHSIALALTTLA
jgi:hypothetical protein